ncbi:isoprenoid synthase domain-containing protein [Mycena amicta]|nr:isoprenoid synthase domain-containing protein [Mycena amicta]
MDDATSYPLVDLQTYCGYPPPTGRHRKQIAIETKAWFHKYKPSKGYEEQCEMVRALNPAVLSTSVYAGAGYTQLRFCSDFLAYLFFLDEISDDLDMKDNISVAHVILNSLVHPNTYHVPARVAIMAKDLIRRLSRTATPGVQHRFIETFGYFFQSVEDQTHHRLTKTIPTLDEYIRLRRDTSACKLCWVVIEWAHNLDIPDEAIHHPVIYGLGEAVNDLVAWSNDLYSYSVERSKGDNHNMIAVVMHHQGLDLVAAAEFVGEMCKESIDRFKALRKRVPSWGEPIDSHVKRYVQGLADWIVGITYWSFTSERYFGKALKTVRDTKRVQLLPIRHPTA